ncbi:pentapeptide repeat-containing protein [Streptomyces sp. NBC_00124]|uniref:pentapeptide repeat-containing protein n=1 Tax=Streptomyces sp. NBC_00124 TaxID=2975662 RepID=UPI002250A580|nr:pentapeptide repeat-containing protein [Streptomyces sp. NBC_00124]MCX5357535.1 pentapeptide repeat-containing protein [Streptomyces sp. NBC_00124]
MSHPSPEPAPTPPSWPHCGHGTTTEDPVGCRGIHVPSHTACLAHLDDADRDAYLAGLIPGTDIDHRGTPFTEPLLDALLVALRDPSTGHPRLGHADFGSATFQGGARFVSATFQGGARFVSATFQGGARFVSATFQGGAGFVSATFERGAGFGAATFQGGAEFESATFQGGAGFGAATFQGGAGFGAATFQGGAEFESATFQGGARFVSAAFQGHAEFESATFQGGTDFGSATFERGAGFGAAIFERSAWFVSATFQGVAEFESATFERDARFGSATFQGDAWFEQAVFERDARFEQAVFERSVSLGPLVCAGRMKLSGAMFGGPVTLSFAARRLECRRTRWSSTAEVRLRYATVDFAHAVFEYPLTIAAEAQPFVLPNGQPVAEQALAGAPDAPDATVRMASLRGVDAAHLVIADVDLSACLFTGTVHLDQLRLEGTCSFNSVPPGTHWRRWRPARFTQRRTLAEEHYWRANQPTAVRGWNVAESGAGHAGPAQLAPVYRALRKAFEDSKNEPGAADFYYGEMEMRRHDRTGASRAERGLIHGYWLLSGYGLRASRAVGWLAAAMLVTIMLLMGFGLPKDSPKQEATGTVPPGGGKVTFEIDKADPQNPTGNRFTGERFEKALNVTLNSVVFRSSGQDLTTTGTYIEMASRVTEPVLLGLAVLAVRNRVKR